MPKLTDRLSSIVATCLCGLALSLGSTSSTFGAAGDTYEYRIVNAYNSETVGRVSYRIDQSQADRVQASVTTDPPAAAAEGRTEPAEARSDEPAGCAASVVALGLCKSN